MTRKDPKRDGVTPCCSYNVAFQLCYAVVALSCLDNISLGVVVGDNRGDIEFTTASEEAFGVAVYSFPEIIIANVKGNIICQLIFLVISINWPWIEEVNLEGSLDILQVNFDIKLP